MVVFVFCVFVFKQKTAYEMRISDWSSDVCSSDLGDNYTEKVFASYPDDVLVVELATSAQEGMDLSLRLDRPEDHGHKTVTTTNPPDTEISMKGMVTQYGGVKDSKTFTWDYGVTFEPRSKLENEWDNVTGKKRQK